jgi:hypothetical protein
MALPVRRGAFSFGGVDTMDRVIFDEMLDCLDSLQTLMPPTTC